MCWDRETSRTAPGDASSTFNRHGGDGPQIGRSPVLDVFEVVIMIDVAIGEMVGSD